MQWGRVHLVKVVKMMILSNFAFFDYNNIWIMPQKELIPEKEMETNVHNKLKIDLKKV